VWPVFYFFGGPLSLPLFFSHPGSPPPPKKLLNIMCVCVCVCWFSQQLLSETFLIWRRIQRDIFINVGRSSCKVLVILVCFNETWNFSTVLRTVFKYKIHENASAGSPVVPCGQTDWRTDMTTLMVAFRNFCNAPINRHVTGEGAPLPAMVLEWVFSHSIWRSSWFSF